jgi:NAD(P)-dependent dehydrogenase (short-subunit alcohol dehydrogenase family)
MVKDGTRRGQIVGGIGRAVAKRLAQDGFTVVENYMSNAAEAEEVVAELKGIGGHAVAIPADVSSPPDVDRLFNETSTKFASVDVVVHNSGIMPLSPIGKNDSELFDKVISTNSTKRVDCRRLVVEARHLLSRVRIRSIDRVFSTTPTTSATLNLTLIGCEVFSKSLD